MKKIVLTGIKSTGMPHLGNYVGAIGPALDLAKSDDVEAFYFIADYHSLNSVHRPNEFRQMTYEVAATWLALGLNPKQATLYKQSDIPEVLELCWILSCFASKGLLNRAHAYKAVVQDNLENNRDADKNVNMGLFSYPILMAADILFLNSDLVPVGSDQLQHIEITRDIANCFNHYYGDVLKLPEALVQSEVLVPGLDGRKMSKSYQNHIPLFLPEKKLKKMINRIVTDSSAPEEPKNPDDSLIFDLYRLLATKVEIADLKSRYLSGIGWGEAKAELFSVLNKKLAEPREIYTDLINHPEKIDIVLEEGASRVRPRAAENLARVKKSIGA